MNYMDQLNQITPFTMENAIGLTFVSSEVEHIDVNTIHGIAVATIDGNSRDYYFGNMPDSLLTWESLDRNRINTESTLIKTLETLADTVFNKHRTSEGKIIICSSFAANWTKRVVDHIIEDQPYAKQLFGEMEFIDPRKLAFGLDRSRDFRTDAKNFIDAMTDMNPPVKGWSLAALYNKYCADRQQVFGTKPITRANQNIILAETLFRLSDEADKQKNGN